MKNGSYFAFGNSLNLLKLIDRWLNPYRYTHVSIMDGNEVRIIMTRRAQQQLEQRERPLIVELQLYFSCVVKKRVLFHEHTKLVSTPVSRHLTLVFHCVQSDVCNPEEFAQHYPGKQTLSTTAALKMHPRELSIDYQDKHWIGEFSV